MYLGTGKTTIARKIGQVFYDMDLLGSSEVIECSASDLVGQYVGQTGPKVKNLFEKALGKVLFVDEAYRLSQGIFAQEAIDEVVGLITQPRFKAKLVIILAGYEHEMNDLMSVNAGLSSRFPKQITFEDMEAEDCITVVRNELAKKTIAVDGIEDPTSALHSEMKEIIRDLAELDNWGNARDMITASKDMVNLALSNGTGSSGGLVLDPSDVLDVLRKMQVARSRRGEVGKVIKKRGPSEPVQSAMADPPAPPPIATSTAADAASPPPPSPRTLSPVASRSPTPSHSERGRGSFPARAARGRGRGAGRVAPNPPRSPLAPRPTAIATGSQDPQRDAGVSDAVWRQLQAAKKAAIEREQNAKKAIDSLSQSAAKEEKAETKENQRMAELANAAADERDAKRRDELLREREAARLKAHAARVAKEKAAAELAAKREAERKRKEEDKKAQKKLRELGVCPAGFRWIRMDSAYRCSAGGHVVSIASLGL